MKGLKIPPWALVSKTRIFHLSYNLSFWSGSHSLLTKGWYQQIKNPDFPEPKRKVTTYFILPFQARISFALFTTAHQKRRKDLSEVPRTPQEVKFWCFASGKLCTCTSRTSDFNEPQSICSTVILGVLILWCLFFVRPDILVLYLNISGDTGDM